MVVGRAFGSVLRLVAAGESVGSGSKILIPEEPPDVSEPGGAGLSWRRRGTWRWDGERFLIILCASWMCSARRTGGGPIAWRAFAGWDIATGPTTARAVRKRIVDLEEGIVGVWWTIKT